MAIPRTGLARAQEGKISARLAVIYLSSADTDRALCVLEFRWKPGLPLLTPGGVGGGLVCQQWRGRQGGYQKQRFGCLSVRCSKESYLAHMFPLPRLFWSPGLEDWEQHLTVVPTSQN
jgi:hypothetical protein